MYRVSKLKTVGRVVSLVFLLVTMMGPWFADSHPTREETCSHPLVWLGDGYCACLVSFTAFVGDVISGQSSLWVICLPPALPVLSSLLLLLISQRRWLWISHLTAWGLVAIYSLLLFFGLWFSNRALVLWGVGFCGVLAIAVLAGEIMVCKSTKLNESP